MRDIKFRGMTIKGEMITGSLVVTDKFIKHMQHCHTKTWIVESAFGNGGWFNVIRKQYVKPETVGQYTGLKDCDGTEIYEGDIIVCDNGFVWLVALGDSGGFIAQEPECKDNFVYCDDYYFRVIGNIHQNPELIK